MVKPLVEYTSLQRRWKCGLHHPSYSLCLVENAFSLSPLNARYRRGCQPRAAAVARRDEIILTSSWHMRGLAIWQKHCRVVAGIAANCISARGRWRCACWRYIENNALSANQLRNALFLEREPAARRQCHRRATCQVWRRGSFLLPNQCHANLKPERHPRETNRTHARWWGNAITRCLTLLRRYAACRRVAVGRLSRRKCQHVYRAGNIGGQ